MSKSDYPSFSEYWESVNNPKPVIDLKDVKKGINNIEYLSEALDLQLLKHKINTLEVYPLDLLPELNVALEDYFTKKCKRSGLEVFCDEVAHPKFDYDRMMRGNKYTLYKYERIAHTYEIYGEGDDLLTSMYNTEVRRISGVLNDEQYKVYSGFMQMYHLIITLSDRVSSCVHDNWSDFSGGILSHLVNDGDSIV